MARIIAGLLAAILGAILGANGLVLSLADGPRPSPSSPAETA